MSTLPSWSLLLYATSTARISLGKTNSTLWNRLIHGYWIGVAEQRPVTQFAQSTCFTMVLTCKLTSTDQLITASPLSAMMGWRIQLLTWTGHLWCHRNISNNNKVSINWRAAEWYLKRLENSLGTSYLNQLISAQLYMLRKSAGTKLSSGQPTSLSPYHKYL